MKYSVCININSTYECIVEADCEDDAYEEAIYQCADDFSFDPLNEVCFGDCDITELN